MYRNIPFAAIGIPVIILFYQSGKKTKDIAFKNMWITFILSSAFYISVVLFGGIVSIIGALMIPKTCAYVWAVLIGYNEIKGLKK